MNVQCDVCNKVFSISSIKSEVQEELLNNVTRHYFTCPGCGCEYTSYFLDHSMREIQQEIMTLKNKVDLKVKQKNRLIKLTHKISAMNAQYMKSYKESLENNA